MNDEKIVCYCSNVTKEQIIVALNDGAKTLEDIRRITGACILGKCRELSPIKKCYSPIIMKIIEEYNKDK